MTLVFIWLALLSIIIIAQLQCRTPWFNSWVGKNLWRRDRPPTPVFLVFPGGSDSKESACNAADRTWVRSLGWEESLEEGMAACSSLPGESPRPEKPGGLQAMGSQRVRHGWVTKHSTHVQITANGRYMLIITNLNNNEKHKEKIFKIPSPQNNHG